MVEGKFHLEQFLGRPEAVAALVSASEVFSLLKRSLDLPAQWAALISKSTGDKQLVPSGELIKSEEADEILLTRTSSLEVAIEQDGLATADQFQCRASIRLQARLIEERSELASFQSTVLGSRRTATTDDLARHFQPALRSALAQFTGNIPVEKLVDGDEEEAARAAIVEALKGSCFTAGLMLESVPSVAFDSASFRKVRRAEEKAARSRGEHRAARELQQAIEQSQREHLDHVTGLLTRLRELATHSPDAELPELIRTFGEEQRGELYGALFKTQPTVRETEWLIVAAGEELLFFYPSDTDRPARRLSITGEAGPVRSVQRTIDAKGRRSLLLGAGMGVYEMSLEAGGPELTLLVAGTPEVRGGFNSVAKTSDTVHASHSELGIWRWRLNEAGPGQPVLASMTEQAKAVRGIQVFDDDAYCALDDRVLRWPASASHPAPEFIYTGSRSMISAVCPSDKGLFAGNSDGEVLHWAGNDRSRPQVLHAGSHRAVESLWFLPTQGVDRLILADTSLCAHARVLGDNFTCRYEAGGQTVRRVEVADDLLVATNDLRDRLFLWKPGEPGRPFATINIAAITRHSIQDVCLVPQA
jgi:hypothetical protein